MIFQYSNGNIYFNGLPVGKVSYERSEIKVEGNYNVILKRKGFEKYDVIQFNSKVGEINRLNLNYGMFNYFVSRPQLVAFIRGYQDSLKIFTSGNIEVGEVKRVQNGLEGYLNDQYDPYVIIIYLAMSSIYATPNSYAPYRPSIRASRYRPLIYFLPFILIFVFLLPIPYYADLILYVALIALFYYFLIFKKIS
ncbi:hypothetical protein BFU36_06455 [Sulfolobus sp. A20]|uniref:hypothetical protein n=2 Tax=Sulfolobaceae TaxID=118883 RepID=UPI0008460F5E|nr:hypothetical protein [Sulfolobus sp. A20]TRM74570.1 hypothetical protein DJ523_04610 [Sulfolobus sp. E5]TRM76804.1 hypothetical protein DJ532_06725 [Sulfolobus sp. A20-N-F8]TRM77153.1 hypothetical protein DJ528_07205 [Sulfolobus sp. B5]TRM84311.1 hypothetical protein DJ531_01195 [Sulfolobus sp. A20-N-F6]TRM89606.1 hypothetical protein DJ529_01205 [Sulfolobus sp. C3]TRM95252.1 hypothetical protein DJ526_00960 [Sulfolobus sp. A20-N-G8]TRM98591.1 hypothetical protein DJ527_10255 [Sulfolobus 